MHEIMGTQLSQRKRFRSNRNLCGHEFHKLHYIPLRTMGIKKTPNFLLKEVQLKIESQLCVPFPTRNNAPYPCIGYTRAGLGIIIY